MSLAWHIEAMRRSKRLPKLQRLLAKPPQRRQTMEEQMQVMSMWSSAMRKWTAAKEKLNG